MRPGRGRQTPARAQAHAAPVPGRQRLPPAPRRAHSGEDARSERNGTSGPAKAGHYDCRSVRLQADRQQLEDFVEIAPQLLAAADVERAVTPAVEIDLDGLLDILLEIGRQP